MTVEVNGIEQIQMTVNDIKKSLPFWESICHFLEMKTLVKNSTTLYCIGSRTGILIREAPEEKKLAIFDQDQVGLHHFCFRAKCREDVDSIIWPKRTAIVRSPEDGDHFAPGYYSILFEDPVGIRVEVNFVPGKGHFGGEGRLAPGGPGPSAVYGKGGI